jgi:hypothetical protein
MKHDDLEDLATKLGRLQRQTEASGDRIIRSAASCIGPTLEFVTGLLAFPEQEEGAAPPPLTPGEWFTLEEEIQIPCIEADCTPFSHEQHTKLLRRRVRIVPAT